MRINLLEAQLFHVLVITLSHSFGLWSTFFNFYWVIEVCIDVPLSQTAFIKWNSLGWQSNVMHLNYSIKSFKIYNIIYKKYTICKIRLWLPERHSIWHFLVCSTMCSWNYSWWIRIHLMYSFVNGFKRICTTFFAH